MNAIMSSVVLSGLVIIYVIFVSVQFQYFFGNSRELVEQLGITYAQYVHSGFYQLVGVVIINLIVGSVFQRGMHTIGSSTQRRTLQILI